MKNTSRAPRDLLDSYDNVVEKLVDYCQTPRTIKDISQKFGLVEAVIIVVFRELVKHGELEVIRKNDDGHDVFKSSKPPLTISSDVSIDESVEQRPESRWWNKILVLGDSGVGKTTLLLRFVDKIKGQDVQPFGVHFHKMSFDYENEPYLIVIYEISGKFGKQVWKNQYATAGGAFFVFDTTDPKTLESIDSWNLTSLTGEGVPLVIVENKIDLGSQIPESLVEAYVEKNGAEYIRVSAKDDDNLLEEVFNRMVLNNLKKAAGNSQKQDSSQT